MGVQNQNIMSTMDTLDMRKQGKKKWCCYEQTVHIFMTLGFCRESEVFSRIITFFFLIMLLN